MVKRKLELRPEEISHNFKKNKFDNANGIVDLLIKIETATNRQLSDCISSLTEIALTIIENGDTVKPTTVKPDDLKNAAEKFKDWIQQRFSDIVKKLTKLLLHPKSSVGEKAMMSLLSIIRQQSRSDEVFPLVSYTKCLRTLLSSRVDCRRQILCLKDPLQNHDLSYYTLRVLSKLVCRRTDNTAPQYKSNLVYLALLINVPPRVNPFGSSSPLWCSSRKAKRKRKFNEVEKKEKKVSGKKQRKVGKKAENLERSKGKYKDLIMQEMKEQAKQDRQRVDSEDDLPQDSDDEDMDSEVGEDINGEADEAGEDMDSDAGEDVDADASAENGNVNTDEKNIENEDVDSDEEQRRLDNEEFLKAQRVKRPRKSSRVMGIEDVTALSEEEGEGSQMLYEKLTMPEYKPVAAKDRMLPSNVFDIKSLYDLIPKGEDGGALQNGGQDSEEKKDLNEGPRFRYDYRLACKFLTMIWQKIMSFTLTEELYKRCLVFIPKEVMEHLNDPVKLTDFFISSYNCGGGVSLMAMHGVFMLMNKHNLHYPEFYPKVYSLLEPSIFNARYRARFFVLLNIFLSSTYLPEYIAAAFVKRLSRLSYLAPNNCTVLVVKAIRNLLARFPSLQTLYNDQKETEVSNDVFCLKQTDLMQSLATKSSLWEVISISKSTAELNKSTLYIRTDREVEEVDLTTHLETEYDELDTCGKETAENVRKPATVFTEHEKTVTEDDTLFCSLN